MLVCACVCVCVCGGTGVCRGRMKTSGLQEEEEKGKNNDAGVAKRGGDGGRVRYESQLHEGEKRGREEEVKKERCTYGIQRQRKAD